MTSTHQPTGANYIGSGSSGVVIKKEVETGEHNLGDNPSHNPSHTLPHSAANLPLLTAPVATTASKNKKKAETTVTPPSATSTAAEEPLVLFD